jgi:hypothetical protein
VQLLLLSQENSGYFKNAQKTKCTASIKNRKENRSVSADKCSVFPPEYTHIQTHKVIHNNTQTVGLTIQEKIASMLLFHVKSVNVTPYTVLESLQNCLSEKIERNEKQSKTELNEIKIVIYYIPQ